MTTVVKKEANRDENNVKAVNFFSRMDNLQAAILDYRLKNLPSIIEQRRKNANLYFKMIDRNNVYIPEEKKK